MLGCATRYTPEQHKLLDLELLHWCRNQTSDERLKRQLFAYKHNLYNTFVIGLWVNQPKGLFVDLINLGFSLAHFTRSTAEELRRRILCPTSSTELNRQMRKARSDYLHQQQDESDELTDYYYRPRKVQAGYGN